MDLIDRQAIHDKVTARYPDSATQYSIGYADAINDVLKDIRYMPSAKTSEVIRCEDCKWWDQKFDDSPMGYCMAAKHNYYSPQGLRSLMEQDMHPTDRQIAEVLDRKLRISYKGKKIRVILTGE